MGDINNLTKVEIKEYVVQAQGIFTGCENDCVTTNNQTMAIANDGMAPTPVGGSAISLGCRTSDPSCSTLFSDAGWPFW